jgi:hypothetical protein
MARKKKQKLDCSKEHQIELRQIIDEQKSIYDTNNYRKQLLNTRRNQEIEIFSLNLFRKIYKDIPVIYQKYIDYQNVIVEPDFDDLSYDNISFLHGQLKRAKIKNNYGEIVELCDIEISETYNINNKYTFRLRFSDDYGKTLSQTAEKLRYLTTAADRFSSLEDDYVSGRNKINYKYDDLCNKIDTRDCYDKWKFAEKEMESIQDHLKFEPNLVYIFNGTPHFQYGRRKRTDSTYIKKLKIIKTTPAYTFIEYQSSYSETWQSCRLKKEKVLQLIKNNSYTFEKNVERTKKLERLLENMSA